MFFFTPALIRCGCNCAPRVSGLSSYARMLVPVVLEDAAIIFGLLSDEQRKMWRLVEMRVSDNLGRVCWKAELNS